jgi:hypothetical protein
LWFGWSLGSCSSGSSDCKETQSSRWSHRLRIGKSGSYLYFLNDPCTRYWLTVLTKKKKYLKSVRHTGDTPFIWYL